MEAYGHHVIELDQETYSYNLNAEAMSGIYPRSATEEEQELEKRENPELKKERKPATPFQGRRRSKASSLAKDGFPRRKRSFEGMSEMNEIFRR